MPDQVQALLSSVDSIQALEEMSEAPLRLEKISIEGFKSFASRIQVQIKPGITAIVGPNGCGKSNIVDAIRWVLGEPSAKSLRADSMQDVLFAGAESSKASSMAQVTLELSGRHPARPLLVDRFEIERRLFRTGESEYRLNKRACRQRDIQELFADTGLGRNAFAIFEQGRLEQMVMMSQAQRRLLIEEAAGVVGFKMQKKEALAKWQLIDAQLEQVNKVYQELDSRLLQLKDQAQKALEWQSCQKEIERLVRLGQIYDWNLLNEKSHRLLIEFKKIEDQANQIRQEKETSQRSIEEIEQSLESREKKISQKRAHYHSVKERVIERTESLKYLQTQKENEDFLKKQLVEELNQTKLKRQGLESQLRSLKEKLEYLHSQIGENESKQAQSESSIRTLKNQQAEAALKRQNFEAGIVEAKHQKQLLEQKQSSHRREKENLVAQIQTSQESIKKYQIEEKALHVELESILRFFKEASSQDKLYQESESLKKQIFEDEKSLEQKTSFLGDIQAQRKQSQTHLKWLETKAAGSKQSFLEWVSKKLTTLEKKMLRSLSELLPKEISKEDLCFFRYLEPVQMISSKLVSKIEVLCQEADCPMFALWIVESSGEEDFEAAARSLILKKLSILLSEERHKRWKKWGSDLVRLDDLNIIWSIDKAVSQAEMLGEIPLEQSRLENLTKEEEAFEKEIKEVRSRLFEAKMKREKLEKEIGSTTLERQTKQSKKEFLENRLVFLKEEIKVKAPILDSLKQRLEPLIQNLQETETELENSKKNLGIEKELNELHAHQQELTRKFYSLKSQKDLIDKTLLLAREERLRIEVQIQSFEESYAQSEIALQVKKEKIEDQGLKEKERVALHEKALQEQALLSKEAEVLGGDLEKEISELEVLKQSVKDLHKTIKIAQNRLEGLQSEMLDKRKKYDEAKWGKESLETIIDREEALLWDGVSMDPVQIEKEIQVLKNRQQELGFVNFAAAKELSDLQDRHGLILAQIQDVQTAKLEIMKVIAHLDDKCRVQFQKTFERVREFFSRNFCEIFEGGKADLVLVGKEESEGIDISACPPGKQIKNLSLMSGGEKCLTALAFMMALFEVKPAPFCLLDEIDAPLDDTNVEKLIRLIKHYSQRTQIFIITHNKKTMAAASTLLGVSMPKRGISELFMLDVGERFFRSTEVHSFN